MQREKKERDSFETRVSAFRTNKQKELKAVCVFSHAIFLFFFLFPTQLTLLFVS